MYVSIFDPNTFDPNLLEPALLKAREVLINGIDPNGNVFERLTKEDKLLYVYAGEMLQAIKALDIPSDINMDGQVDCTDLDILLENLLITGCDQCCWCNRSDINHDGIVDMYDLLILIDNWLRGKI